MGKKKKVLIALKMAGIAGQGKLAGIFRYLKERYGEVAPWDVQLVRTRSELTKDAIRHAMKNGADGFIVSIPDTEEAVMPLADSLTPTIIMDIHSETLGKRSRNIAFIRNSADAIGREAANFLVGQGIARSYAFLHPDPVTDWSKARFEAFKSMLNDSGLWCEELFEPASVARLRRPAAVLAANDDRAFDLLKFLSAKRIKVPQSVAVVGVDNDVLICENAHPRLSSVQPDFEQEGRLAAELLDRMMAKPSSSAVLDHSIPSKLLHSVGVSKIVRRESTAEQSHAGRLVQKAVAYIDGHALDGIGVKDVVRHLKCSRRLADLRFRELQGRSILEAITERRLDEVKRQLAGTRETMDSIAASCGYGNPNYLKNLFRKRFGMSMREFRRSARGK